MNELFFNIDYGYVDALLRGYRDGLLKSSQYVNLIQCKSLEDVKLQLSVTDYNDVFSSHTGNVTIKCFHELLSESLFRKFHYLKSQSSGVMEKFIEYITFSYMIDNILLVITGTLHEYNKSDILSKCHPLGLFDTLPTLSIANDIKSLFETVLIDTPLAPYFKNCFTYKDLDDLNIEIIRNKLYKNYLEDFVKFIKKKFKGQDKEIMLKILSFEADKRVINITINSMCNSEVPSKVKMSLYPCWGKFYPDYHEKLSQTENVEQLKQIINLFEEYKQFFDSGFIKNSNSSNLEIKFHILEMQFYKNVFTHQFVLSSIWAWLKSKEQEIRNINWIVECILQKQTSKINNYISVY